MYLICWAHISRSIFSMSWIINRVFAYFNFVPTNVQFKSIKIQSIIRQEQDEIFVFRCVQFLVSCTIWHHHIVFFIGRYKICSQTLWLPFQLDFEDIYVQRKEFPFIDLTSFRLQSMSIFNTARNHVLWSKFTY